jgi:hypothetical protein
MVTCLVFLQYICEGCWKIDASVQWECFSILDTWSPLRLLLQGDEVPLSANVMKFAWIASGKTADFVVLTVTALYAYGYILVNSILFQSFTYRKNDWASNCKGNMSRRFSNPMTYPASLFGPGSGERGFSTLQLCRYWWHVWISGVSFWVFPLVNFLLIVKPLHSVKLALPLKRSSFGWNRLEQFSLKIEGISPTYSDTWMINTVSFYNNCNTNLSHQLSGWKVDRCTESRSCKARNDLSSTSVC